MLLIMKSLKKSINSLLKIIIMSGFIINGFEGLGNLFSTSPKSLSFILILVLGLNFILTFLNEYNKLKIDQRKYNINNEL